MNAALAALCSLLLPFAHVGTLGDRRFRTREAATAALRRAGDAALPAIEWAAARHTDPEVRTRCTALLAPHLDRLAGRDAARLLAGWPHLPWIWDAGRSYGGDGVGYWLDRAGWGKQWDDADAARQRKGLPPDWPRWREATRLWAVQQFRSGRTAADIDGDLGAMHEAERRWCADHADEFMPPLAVPPKR